jgi:uncharacterized YigZ family protein
VNQPSEKIKVAPANEARQEIIIQKSRFIATAAPVRSVDEARAFLARIKQEFPDASHHVPAFIIGFGNSTITHSSDAGEPSGTAGRPVLSLLLGSGLGNICVVVTRYFGGIKLGTGGLVRAYSDATRAVLEILPMVQIIPVRQALISVQYSSYDRLKILLQQHHGNLLDSSFSTDVVVSVQLRAEDLDGFVKDLMEYTNGNATVMPDEMTEAAIPYNKPTGSSSIKPNQNR